MWLARAWRRWAGPGFLSPHTAHRAQAASCWPGSTRGGQPGQLVGALPLHTHPGAPSSSVLSPSAVLGVPSWSAWSPSGLAGSPWGLTLVQDVAVHLGPESDQPLSPAL